MTRCFLSYFVFVLAATVSAGPAEHPLSGFDEYVHQALVDWQTPGVAVAILRDDETLLLRGYGVRRLDDLETVDENTVFPIASVTKVFTATGMALLVEEGRVLWDDPVVKHLPEFQLADADLTRRVQILDLLSHRTGLERADLIAYRGDCERAELMRRLRLLKPSSPFRSGYGYNNLMYIAAGELSARVARTPWEEFITKRVVRPLNLRSTTVGLPPDSTNRVAAHTWVDGQLRIDPLLDGGSDGLRRFRRASAPAGSIYSTISDMARFLRLYLDEGVLDGRRFLKQQTARDMAAPRSVLPILTAPEQRLPYPRFFFGAGLGWQLRDYRGRKIVYHPGSSGAVLAMMPEENIGVVVLANRGCGIPFMIMHDVFDRLLGIERDVTNAEWIEEGLRGPERTKSERLRELDAQRSKDTQPKLPLPRYAGIYHAPLYGDLEIRHTDGALRLQFGPNIHAVLSHWEHDTFRATLNFPPPGEWLVRFVVEAGAPKRIHVERLFWHEPMPPFERQP